jgi:oxygen-dependent protoporphyrinogen oxidase
VLRVAVIGGGLAGLTVAFRRQALGDEVVVFEAAARLGGQLHSERSAGFLIEHGAEGFTAGSQALPKLAFDVGIGDSLTEQLTTRSYGFDANGLRLLGPGEAAQFLGFQVARDDLGRGIRAFTTGMQAIIEALTVALDGRVELHLDDPVRALEATGAHWRVHPRASSARDFDAVVLTTSSAAAATLLEDAFGASARQLGAASTLSSLTVSLAYTRDQVQHPLDATGFVVAGDQQQHGFRACTFSSSKFAGRAPESHVLLRAFFRPPPGELTGLTDATWVQRAHTALDAALSVQGQPRRAWISRWANALPLFDAPHLACIRTLEAELLGTRIALAGSAFHGSGIDAAVRSAEAAASSSATFG